MKSIVEIVETVHHRRDWDGGIDEQIIHHEFLLESIRGFRKYRWNHSDNYHYSIVALDQEISCTEADYNQIKHRWDNWR